MKLFFTNRPLSPDLQRQYDRAKGPLYSRYLARLPNGSEWIKVFLTRYEPIADPVTNEVHAYFHVSVSVTTLADDPPHRRATDEEMEAVKVFLKHPNLTEKDWPPHFKTETPGNPILRHLWGEPMKRPGSS